MSIVLISILSYYVLVSLFAFFAMYYDKKKSTQGTNGKGRVKEKSLLIYAIIGGSIGSLLGMYKLRHKTKHMSFIVVFWFSLIIHILLILFLLYKNYI